AAARSGGGSTRAASRPATGGATRARSTAASRGRSTPAPRRTPPRRTRRTRLIRLGDPGRRLGVGFAAVCTLLVVLGGRLVQLQGFDGARLAAKAQQQRLNSTPITAVRGKILDRDGRVLAYTVAARTIFADPKLVVDPVATAAELAPLLGQNADSLVAKLRKKGRYVPLARDVSPTDAARIQARGLKGIGAQDTTQRLYPGREVGAGVIGFTGVDGGLAGIEQRYDRQLAGTPGELVVERGTDGTPIPSGRREETDAVPGSSVHLTLDEDLQYVAQRALADAVKKAQASGGQLVVLDVHTGEVLAMATAPTYDAQAPAAADPARRGNPAVSDVIEPGSANKVVTFSAAVDRGLIRPDTPMSVPDSYRVADRVVHDAWSHKVERWTATGVLAKSSNVGTLMIAHALGPSAFYDYLTRFGIGTKTGIELPAESGGILPKPEEWSGSTFGNLPIGQGVSMTALQLAGMYQTIGNGGVRISPRIVRGVTAPDGTVTSGAAPTRTTVVSPQAARTVRTMLEAVTGPGGTAPKAAIDGYRVAGKTGTAQKPNPACHCYSGGGYWATFAGMAPADDPQLVISVVIDEAKGGGHGGAVAAPLFHQVMSYALTARGVAPTGTPKPTARLTVD
ncbi:MAG TPA: penicillin-binding protein 2, partial [Mycobacteriales bacterium]|nr:penicillin-binding protein 2 [Mycobacteriales bacterium]